MDKLLKSERWKINSSTELLARLIQQDNNYIVEVTEWVQSHNLGIGSKHGDIKFKQNFIDLKSAETSYANVLMAWK